MFKPMHYFSSAMILLFTWVELSNLFNLFFSSLGKFDLDSHLAIKEKEATRLEPSISVELGLNETQQRDLPTKMMDILKIDSTKAPSKPETSSSTSRPPSTENQTSKLPSFDLSNGSEKSTRRLFNGPSISGIVKYRDGQVAQSHSSGPCISGSVKYRDAQVAQSYSVKGNSDNKTDSSVQSLDSHPQVMTSASPVTSSNNQDNVSGAFSLDCGVRKTNDSVTLSVLNESERNSIGVEEVGVESGKNLTATTSATQRLVSKIMSLMASGFIDWIIEFLI
jgi:hypothetical protein